MTVTCLIAPAAWRYLPRSFALLCLFRNFVPGPGHFLHHFLMHFYLSFHSQTITCGKLGILIGRSHLDNNSGSLAMFAAIRRASPRASGFVFSFEHLAVGLKNRHHG